MRPGADLVKSTQGVGADRKKRRKWESRSWGNQAPTEEQKVNGKSDGNNGDRPGEENQKTPTWKKLKRKKA